jgi:hypothetical protein
MFEAAFPESVSSRRRIGLIMGDAKRSDACVHYSKAMFSQNGLELLRVTYYSTGTNWVNLVPSCYC